MFRRIPIRAKVAAALAVPLLGLVTAATVGASATTASARHAADQAELALASLGHAGLVTALQDERDLALVDMLGLREGIVLEVEDHATARRRTTLAASELRRALDGQDAEVREHYTAALARLGELDGLRARVDGGEPGAALEAFTGYTSIIADLFAAHDRFALGIDDPDLRRGDDLVHGSALAADLAAQLVAELLHVGTGPGGVDRVDEVARLSGLRDALERAHAALATRGTGDHAAAVDALLGNPRVTGLPALARSAVESGGPVDPAAVLAAAPLGPQGGHVPFREVVVAQVEERADELRAGAAARRRLFIGGALALVAVAILVAWLVSRSITRPLRELSIRARQIASYRLPCAVQDALDPPPGEPAPTEPDAIEVPARDEVREVADAFNDVQVAAITLAAEQAVLRRNVAESHLDLGRRMQNLLGRLLDALRDLQAGEDDPDRQRRLFRVTHLATRLRRNAESLLVLAGAEPAVGWHPPVPVDEVVQGALGEVEQFDRVVVRPLEPVALVGGAAGDVTHLLAELIENGLRHSPPRELVEVSGRRQGDAYEVVVVDHGLGMAADELERANRRLAGAEPFATTSAKHLGHHVVAVLAARHGIGVRLTGDVVAGITAHVTLPPAILAEVEAAVARPAGVGGPTAAGAPALPGAPAAPVHEPVGHHPVPAAPVATGAAAGGVPERTPSGLVRRVPGAARRGPTARAVAPAAPQGAGGPSSVATGAEGLRRFLSDLSAGVDRSLAAQGPGTDGDDG